VVALANVGRFSEVDARRLRDYLQNGGRVLLFAGDQFTPRAAQPLADAGILPAKLAAAGNLGSYRVASWTKDHPIFRPFADPQYGDLRKLRFRKLAALEPTSNAQTLLETPAGQPLIVEGTVGDGKVVVFASTVDTAWSDWPRSRLFVPLIRQLFAYLTDQHLRESRIVSQAAVQVPGIVTEGDRIVVSNVVPEESELARVTPEQFREAMRLPERQELADLSPEELASLAAPADSQRPNELWELVAWTLLGWLVVETFLAGQVHA
jgi:hypothetical protein